MPEGELEGSVPGLDLAPGHGWTRPRSPRRCAKPTWTSATLAAPGSLLSAPPRRLQDAGLQGAPILAFQSPQEPPPGARGCEKAEGGRGRGGEKSFIYCPKQTPLCAAGNTGGLTEEETSAVFRGSSSTNRLSWLRVAPARALTPCPRWGPRGSADFCWAGRQAARGKSELRASPYPPPARPPPHAEEGDPHPQAPTECFVNLLPSNSQSHPHEQGTSFS